MTVTDDSTASLEVKPAAHDAPPATSRVAIFGLGRSGLMHGAVLSTVPGAEVVAIGDPRREARRNARGMGLAARPFSELQSLLEKSAPDAVWLCGASEERVALAKQCLAARAAVLIEGAPVLPSGEVASLHQFASGRDPMVAFSVPLAHHSVFDAARRAVASGALGSVREVRASRYVSRVFAPAQHRAQLERGLSRGVLAHAAGDLVLALTTMFGAPERVSATASRLYGPLDDEMRGSWTVGRGTHVEFEASWSTPAYPRPSTVIEVEAELGRLLVSEDAMEIDLLWASNPFPPGVTRLGRADVPQPARFDLDGDTLWMQDTAFLGWIRGGPEPPTRLAAYAEAARIVEALYASASAGGERQEIAA